MTIDTINERTWLPKISIQKDRAHEVVEGKKYLKKKSSLFNWMKEKSEKIIGKHTIASDDDLITFCGFSALILITFISFPTEYTLDKSIGNVWWYGWITAIFTGFGALPFMFTKAVNTFFVGISNGLAAGMMLAASCILAYEGFNCVDNHDEYIASSSRTMLGFFTGLLFIFYTKRFLDTRDDLRLENLNGFDSRKAILLIGVMTLHSFSEGVSVGVSFGGDVGHSRGILISTTLAIHNIPEGVAVTLVLVPHGLPWMKAFLWCVFSSLPQPIMAVIAFVFVEQFIFILPIGFGFAGGAMIYVVCTELLPESIQETKSIFMSGCTFFFSSILMLFLYYIGMYSKK